MYTQIKDIKIIDIILNYTKKMLYILIDKTFKIHK